MHSIFLLLFFYFPSSIYQHNIVIPSTQANKISIKFKADIRSLKFSQEMGASLMVVFHSFQLFLSFKLFYAMFVAVVPRKNLCNPRQLTHWFYFGHLNWSTGKQKFNELICEFFNLKWTQVTFISCSVTYCDLHPSIYCVYI